MLYIQNKCPNCGAVISVADTYCRTCYNAIERERIQEEATLEGIAVSDWHLFIDKNSSRYVEIFSKYEGKKTFFNMNWSAMFFSFYWMLYRKMYKYAFLFLLITTVLSIGLTALAAIAVKPAMLEAQKIIEPYSQYLDDRSSLYAAYSDGSVDFTEVLNATSEYNREVRSVIGRFSFIATIPLLIFYVLFGLLADCIYRHYILKNIRQKSGGTSCWSLAVGVIAYVLTNNLIVGPLVTSIVSRVLQ